MVPSHSNTKAHAYLDVCLFYHDISIPYILDMKGHEMDMFRRYCNWNYSGVIE
jgi:hypothetical protein